MVSSEIKSAAAAGKSARPCDYCVKTRARWYCAADDAFLCQSCDSSVHSANPVAQRHQRVRLKTASLKEVNVNVNIPIWHGGFRRKARTPRQKKIADEVVIRVPENEERSEKNEVQMLYEVPSFDCKAGDSGGESAARDFNEFFHSDLDLAEFAADVESFLGKGIENETFDMEDLGILGCHNRVKMEEDETATGKLSDHRPESFEHDSQFIEEDSIETAHDSSKIFLKLDYEGVSSAWVGNRSPWTTGERPDLNSHHCWLPDCTGYCGKAHGYGTMGTVIGNIADDGGREARVSRYREKRRTRLFSKKIRYEVRKLNAEKRPRMKGRFVKRASLVASLMK